MKYLSTDRCGICGHFRTDHDIRKTLDIHKPFASICWECADELEQFNNYINLDAYHKFKFGNLEYLEQLYKKKHKIK